METYSAEIEELKGLISENEEVLKRLEEGRQDILDEIETLEIRLANLKGSIHTRQEHCRKLQEKLKTLRKAQSPEIPKRQGCKKE